MFFDGALLPHMELSHGRFAEGLSIEVACGDHHREKIGNKAWRKLVMSALDAFEAMVLPDHLFVGGGNAKRLDPDALGPNRSVVPEHLRPARRHQALGTRRRGRGARRRPHAREVLRPSRASPPSPLAEGSPRGRHRADRHHRDPRVGRGRPAPRRRGPAPPARPVRRRPRARRGADRDRRGPGAGLLQEPHHPRHRPAAHRARPAGGAARAHRGDVLRACTSTPARTGRCCTRRCGCPTTRR